MTRFFQLKLIIIHHHFRPGGVRRVLELTTPYLARTLQPAVRQVIMAGCDTPEEGWWREFCGLLEPLPVTVRTDPVFGYLSEQHAAPRQVRARLRACLADLLAGCQPGECVVWAHNQGLGRNLLLTHELGEACAARRVPLVFHHHDWWFDNRWQRWPEMRRFGFRSLAQVAKSILVTSPNTLHFAINLADAAVLQRHFPSQAGWLPNPASARLHFTRKGCRRAREWLHRQLGQDAPVWLMPCRLLRRKNIGEALLLTRWLRPEAWLVTTGAVTSPEEKPYADRLNAAARKHGWRLRLSVLERSQASRPSMPELLAASEVVLLTSLQEGFGLSYIEAAVARRPLIARSLPNIAPDLAAWGLRFPQSYQELLVDPALFDWRAEVGRQEQLLRIWKTQLPAAVRRWVGPPILLASCPAGPVPFSRLTLTAQLEVLAHPPVESFERCLGSNPWLADWRKAAVLGTLRVTPLGSKAQRSLSGASFATRFSELLRAAPKTGAPASASVAAQQEFIRAKLQTSNLYPLTWNPQT